MGGNVFTHATLAVNVPNMAFPPAQFLYLASAARQMTGMPVFYANNVKDLATASRAVEEGHCDMLGMTRGHIADPYIVRKLMEGRLDDIRQCVGASYCLDRVWLGADALCIQNAATGREATMPHLISRTTGPIRKIVVAGAGPAGLEAARVAAERGHKVVLFEKEAEAGGQIRIAAKAGWREALSGIPRWLDGQVKKLGVDYRLGAEATAAAVTAEAPDIVIVATGGRPNLAVVKGGPEFAVSSWDILTGKAAPGENVLVYDAQSGHGGPSTAEFLAKRGSLVEVVTYDPALGAEMGSNNWAIHLRELYKAGVVITPNHQVSQVYREGNKLVAVLKNEYTDQEEERVIDQLVIEHGTLPADELYFALKPLRQQPRPDRPAGAGRRQTPDDPHQPRRKLPALPRRRRRRQPQHPCGDLRLIAAVQGFLRDLRIRPSRHAGLDPRLSGRQASLSLPSWSAKADHPRVCQPLIRCLPPISPIDQRGSVRRQVF